MPKTSFTRLKISSPGSGQTSYLRTFGRFIVIEDATYSGAGAGNVFAPDTLLNGSYPAIKNATYRFPKAFNQIEIFWGSDEGDITFLVHESPCVGYRAPRPTLGLELDYLWFSQQEVGFTSAPTNAVVRIPVPATLYGSIPWLDGYQWDSNGIITIDNTNPSYSANHIRVDKDENVLFANGHNPRSTKRYNATTGALEQGGGTHVWNMAIDRVNKRIAGRNGSNIDEWDYDLNFTRTIRAIGVSTSCHAYSNDAAYYLAYHHGARNVDIYNNSDGTLAGFISIPGSSGGDSGHGACDDSAGYYFCSVIVGGVFRLYRIEFPTLANVTELVSNIDAGFCLDTLNQKVLYVDSNDNDLRAINYDGSDNQKVFNQGTAIDLKSVHAGMG